MRVFRMLIYITTFVMSLFLGKKKDVLKYRTSNDLSADIMYLFCPEENGPCFTIETYPNLDSPEGFVILPSEGDGWVDVGVKVLNEGMIKKILAHINKTDPNNIHLDHPRWSVVAA